MGFMAVCPWFQQEPLFALGQWPQYLIFCLALYFCIRQWKLLLGAGGVGQRYSAYLVYTKPWVQFPHQQIGNRVDMYAHTYICICVRMCVHMSVGDVGVEPNACHML